MPPSGKQSSTQKKKPSDKARATSRAGSRRGAAPRGVPASQKQRSQGRYPGETPLTGEDRPDNRRGPKKQSDRAHGERKKRGT